MAKFNIELELDWLEEEQNFDEVLKEEIMHKVETRVIGNVIQELTDKLNSKLNDTIEMKPIIFSTQDVRAIQEGRKTQMRQVIKPQPIPILPITIDGEVCLSWSHEQPYKSGDILWVKETWQKGSLLSSTEETFKKYVYKADDIKNKRWWIKWCSPVSMPKEAARIFLKVKSIQPERLQDISGFDCVRTAAKKLRNN